jgi:tRNA(Ile)-lysidine synthase
MELETAVRQTIRRHNLLGSGQSVLVGLSGGPDSVALLHVLISLADVFSCRIAAVHINHRLRGRDSDADVGFCEDICKCRGVDLTVVSEDIKTLSNSIGCGVEETARDFRYGVFESLAEQDGHDRIATGHHADDQVETILFHVLRGSGRRGLLGIPARRGSIIRPLIECRKSDILEYLAAHKLEYRLDRSNASADYTRNYIRTRLLPQVRKRINPQADAAILSMRDLLGAEDAVLEELTDTAWKHLARYTPGGKIALAADNWEKYDKALRRRALRRCLNELQRSAGGADRDVIERIDAFCLGRSRGLSLPGDLRAVRTSEDAVIVAPRREITFSYGLNVPGAVEVEAIRGKLTARKARPGTNSLPRRRKALRVEIDLDRLALPLEVRSPRQGDRFRPLGLRGTKKVADFLADRKVPRVLRDEVALVCDREGIVWVAGFEIAERVKTDRTTERRLRLEFRYSKAASATAR